MGKQELTLREKKYAKLKLNILESFENKLKQKSLSEISVKEIAQELDISEMTFFNYFGSKKEVLIYFIELWSLQMQLLVKDKEPIDAIYLVFLESAKIIEDNPNLFMEIVSSMALYGMHKKDIAITKAEKILRFGIDINFQVGGFKEVIEPLLNRLNLEKESKEFIYTALFNTFFATPILIRCPEFNDLKEQYTKQLDFILKDIK